MKHSVEPISSISGTIQVPGDKSISHRAVMLGSLAVGTTQVNGFLNGEDCLSTVRIFKQLGVEIEQTGETAYNIHGKGLRGLQEPKQVLDVGNSGTTIRLMTGILSGQSFYSVLTGDSSIVRRPMKRVIEPLRRMGAMIDGREEGGFAPLSIRGSRLKGISYQSPVASAQIKSALLFAGLYAEGKTTVNEPSLSRDHSEKMLQQFGAKLQIEDDSVTIWPEPSLRGQELSVPGDFSSAAFFIAATLITPNSTLRIQNVGFNPTRIGFLEAVWKMGGSIEIEEIRHFGQEPVADLLIKSSALQGIDISDEWIPKIIDELPLLAVIASQAEGVTKVTDAKELRVKETDRIETIVSEMRKVGVKIEELEDGFIIEGKQQIKGGLITTHGDHRIGMALAIAGLIAKQSITIDMAEAINVSFPNFFNELNKISKY